MSTSPPAAALELPPTALNAQQEADDARWTPGKIALWVAITLVGAAAWSVLAISRGETINAVWFVLAAVCTYLVGYRFYSKMIERRVAQPDDTRATPAEYNSNGRDYVPTDRVVLFGHHFAAIAGAGPLVGPVLAAQMGYLPGTIWIVVGAVLAGCVQDYLVMFFSMRRGGRSLGQMAREELGVVGGTAALLATLAIMIIIVAILALVVVNALGESPWGVYSVSLTIPIALFMGCYLRYLRPGKVLEISLIGLVLLMLAIISGRWVAESEWGSALFHLDRLTLAWAIIVYGFVAAILPVWLLLAPRDYLSTFMKIGVIGLLAIAILVVRPEITVPAFSEFANRADGPVVPGSLFPFLFVTIACGALSGFHALISSGTTPKLVEKERQTRFLGYGGMLMESLVAIMALVAAISIDRGIYFAMNVSAASTGGTVDSAVAFVNSLGLAGVHLTPDMLTDLARNVGEPSIISRTGGAPTLSVGIAHIMHQWFGGTAMMGFWYHFAIMFEALFILTAVDAGTRAGTLHAAGHHRQLLPQVQGHVLAPRRLAVHGDHGGRLGLHPHPGRDRPAGRHQYLLPAVRHRQPTAGRHRTGGGDGHRGQTRQLPLPVGRRRAPGLHRHHHALGVLGKRFSPTSPRSATGRSTPPSRTRWRRVKPASAPLTRWKPCRPWCATPSCRGRCRSSSSCWRSSSWARPSWRPGAPTAVLTRSTTPKTPASSHACSRRPACCRQPRKKPCWPAGKPCRPGPRRP